MAKTKIAINGFGRIGKMVFRAALTRPDFLKECEIVAVNDLSDAKTLAHLLKYDSVHGTLHKDFKADGREFSVEGMHVKVLSERDPVSLPWKQLGVDVVLESTGKFTDKQDASKHLDAGAKRVLVSAPGKGLDGTFVIGINDDSYDKVKHKIVSMASCTTNCLAPVAKMIDDAFKIQKGFMTTVHAYTNDQRILDLTHKDLRRARAAALSIIPTTTGAAKAIGEVLPNLKGKLDGLAFRVPVPDGSCNDLTVFVEKETTREEVNLVLKKGSEKEFKGLVEYSEEPLVSSDIIGNPHSAIVDGLSTVVVGGNAVKVLSWYDNEWGYSNRILDLLKKMR